MAFPIHPGKNLGSQAATLRLPKYCRKKGVKLKAEENLYNFAVKN